MSRGLKYDGDKPPVALIPISAVLEEAKVLGFGADKYDTDNWRNGIEYRRLISAALRHLLAISDGEDVDPESNLLHAAHVRCCMAFLIEQYETYPELDDRFKRDDEVTQ